MRKRRLAAVVIAVLVSSCGTSSPTTPTPTTGVNVTGTWTGNFTRVGSDGFRPIRSWVAVQSGANVSGAMIIDAGGGDVINATLTGTVSGAQLTSATFTVAAGSSSFLPTCSFVGTGTLAVSATSISGAMAMTFAAPCVGPNLASATPTDTWTLTLRK